MIMNANAVGLAALSICESLLLSLTDLKVIDSTEATSILKDAATAHLGAMAEAETPESHQAAADVIERIIKGRNSVRHD